MTVLPPPPPPRQELQPVAASFPPPTGAQLLRGLRAPAVGYAWLLLGAVTMMVLIVLAVNVGSTGDETGVESDDTNALGVLLGMPFQIAGMALFGSLHFSEDGVRASVFLPPLLLTALYLLGTWRSARRADVVPMAGTRALLSVIVGAAAAVVLTVVTRVLAMRSDGTTLHAASVSLFFGAWALTALATFAGTSLAAGARRPVWVPGDYLVAARVWGWSVLVWIVASALVLSVVGAVKEALWVGLLFPVWGVTAGLYTYSLAHLGGVSSAGETSNLSDVGVGWAVVLVVGALLLAALVCTAWHLRRSPGAALGLPGSWVPLPLAYGVGGLLVWLLPTIVLGGGYGSLGGSVTVQPAFWTPFVLVVWGLALEAASRFVAPRLVSASPAAVVTLLRGPERREPTEPVAPPAGVPARPLTPQERARYKAMGIVAGVLVSVGIAGWVVVSVVNSTVYGPEDEAAAYLDAVVDGDLETALDLAPTDGDFADDRLMTSEIYGASEERITGYDITGTDTDSGTGAVTVDVTLQGLDASADVTLTMQKDGHRDVLFDDWSVTDGGLAKAVSLYLPDSADEVTINGVGVDLDAGVVGSDLWLLPGDYVVDAFGGNPWLEGADEPLTVSPDEDYQSLDIEPPTASDAFREEVQRQVDEFVAGCMAATELEPEGCPNQVYAGSDARNVVWTLDEAPTPDFEYFDGAFPADLGYGEPGHATVTYEYDQSYGFGKPDWQPQTDETDLYLDAVTVDEDGEGLVVTVGAS